MAVKHEYIHIFHAVTSSLLIISGLVVLFKGENIFPIFFGGKKISLEFHKTLVGVYIVTNTHLSLKIIKDIGARGDLNLKPFFLKFNKLKLLFENLFEIYKSCEEKSSIPVCFTKALRIIPNSAGCQTL